VSTYEQYLPPKTQRDLVADIVPWRAVLAPNVIVHKGAGHSLQRSYAVRGPDVVGVAREVQGVLTMQANNAIKRLGGQWMWQSEAQRLEVLALEPVPVTAPPLVRLLDAAYRATLLAAPGLYETKYFQTLCWTPRPAGAARAAQWFVRGPGAPVTAPDEASASVLHFVEQADSFMYFLKSVLATARPLSTLETLDYLHSCVSSQRDRIIKLPGSLIDIDQYLCDSPLDPSGWYPQLGDWHVRTCSLKAYPRESVVGMLRTLEALGIPFRWCTRWIALEKQVQEGVLRKAQSAWVHTEKTMGDRVSENLTHEGTRILNRTATNNAEDVDIARQEVGADVLAFGGFTSTVTVWDVDPLVADEHRRLVMQAFAQHGIGAVAEKGHQEAAWRSSHPGNRLDNVNATHQSTMTAAHLTPGITAAWRGPSRDAYMDGGPWFHARTENHTLFRVVNHSYDDQTEDVRDLGHFLVLGATGAGKTTLSNWLRLMWGQYRQAQSKTFDIKRGAMLLTFLLGGSWYDLANRRFQPLRHVDQPARYPTILSWAVDLCDEAEVGNLLLAERYLDSGLKRLAQRPPHERTFTMLLHLFSEAPPGQHSAFGHKRIKVDGSGVAHLDTTLSELDKVQMYVRYTLQRYADRDGDKGIFDGTEEDFDTNPIQTFELDELLDRPRLLDPVMRYVLPEVEYQMSTDRKMLLIFDDAAIPLEITRIRRNAKEWLRTARKLGVSVGFATHSLDDLFSKGGVIGEELAAILLESCPVRFYLANPEASKETIRAIYRKMGLEDTAIDTIAVMRPQRDVYYELREMGQRPISLEFPKVVLDCLARNTAADQRLIADVLQQEGREGFAARWFELHGYTEEADFLRKAPGMMQG
jgi:type IV secretion system protein TrbE